MKKTGSEIEADMFELINSSALKTAISGSVYKTGMRPLNSKTEDVVIAFIAGLDAQIQTGVVRVNVYVSDIDNGTGVFVKNSSRCKALEILTNGIVLGFTPGEYRFQLGGMIQTVKAEGLNQHYVSANIKFQLSTL